MAVRDSVETLEHAKTFIGQNIVRREDERLLRGLGAYVDDIELSATLHVAFVRSDHAHAALEVVDGSAALAAGAAAVFRSVDFPAAALPAPPAFTGMTCVAIEQPVLAAGSVHYQGQPVAAVVAESRARAEDFAELVRVEESPLSVVTNVRDGLRDDRNVLLRFCAGTGNVDEAFADAAVRISKTIVIPRVVAAPMETRGALAVYDRGRDLLTVWCSAQDPHRHREQLADVLGRPESTIRVIVPDVGGAFGSKGSLAAEVAVTALAAIQLGRPVRWTEDRLENFRGASQGRGLEADIELGIDAQGKFLALRALLLSDVGAFTHVNSPNSGRTAAMLLSGVYVFPNSSVTLIGVRTNRVPIGVYRGAGRPEAAIIIEQMVDAAGRACGLSPEEIRRKNLIASDAFPYRNGLGLTYDSGNYPALLRQVCDLAELPHRRERQILERLEGRVVGLGFGMYLERSGGGWESAGIEIDRDGLAVVRLGSCPHGQGHETAFAQIVADALDIAIENVRVLWGDSAIVPRGVGTFGSRSIALGGSAAHVAALRLRTKLTDIAAHVLDVPRETLSLSTGTFATPSGSSITFLEIAELAYDANRLPDSMELGLSVTENFSAPFSFSSGAYVADVEIDRDTGRLSVRDLIAVDDPGRVINPLLAAGQVFGGVAQGLGEAVIEEACCDVMGQPLTVSFLDYGMLGESDMPPIQTVFRESSAPHSPIGAKGVGEGGACGAPAAICNAVADAVAPHGSPAVNMPFSPEKLWMALNARDVSRSS